MLAIPTSAPSDKVKCYLFICYNQFKLEIIILNGFLYNWVRFILISRI